MRPTAPEMFKVAARYQAGMDLGAKRELRNMARRVFLDAYAQNQAAIKEAYPRDRTMQDLFFDDVRDRATPAETAPAPAVAASADPN